MHELKDLQDPVVQARVGAAIESAVRQSFLGERPSTQHEIVRRTRICIEHFKIMRNDMRWSITKICDLLPLALIEELDSGNAASLIDKMAKRGWVQVEQQTEAGIVLPPRL